MLEVRYFLVNLLCVFIPLFYVEARYLFGRKSYIDVSRVNRFVPVTLFASSFLCTLFNFPISHRITLNLSIVPLAIGFFILPWLLGWAVLGLYVVSELVLSLFKIAAGHLTLHAVTAALVDLPRGLVMILVFALIMSLTSITTRNQTFTRRACAFVGSLLIYTLLDYLSVHLAGDFPHFKFGPFIGPFVGFVLVLNLTFLLAVRMLVAVNDSHQRRLHEVRLDKLELVSQLAASVAHEIRNPITVVLGFAQLMRDQEYNRTKTVEFLETMIGELSRAESVVSDYLELAKSPVDQDQNQFNLSSVIQKCVEVMQPFAVSNSIDIETLIENDLIIYGGRDSVTRMVINLMKNAIEAYDHPGTINVDLRRVGNVVELTVSDSGRGMSPLSLRRLGEPYYSTKTKGTGLGLTMAYKVVSDIHGKIQVQSKEGIGTRFVIRIPEVTIKPGLLAMKQRWQTGAPLGDDTALH